MSKKKLEKVEHKCNLKEVLDIMGGKWSIPIISTLLDGTMRFSELERTIPNINTRMLVKELKNMEANEIVKREVFATVPPTVEYSLTVKGQKLKPIVDELHKWGEEFVK
jgi:DNA-binding HxlR family transcriptional regulator